MCKVWAGFVLIVKWFAFGLHNSKTVSTWFVLGLYHPKHPKPTRTLHLVSSRLEFGLYLVCFSLLGASWEVSGPAHGPRVDVVQLAARARTPDLIAPSVLGELILASSHRGRNGAVIPHRNKRQPAQNTSDGRHVGNRARLGLIQLLCPALASLPPPSGGAPEGQEINTVHTQFRFGLHKVL
jgi:hypothetical protein